MADPLFVKLLLSAFNGVWIRAFKSDKARAVAKAIDDAVYAEAQAVSALDIDWEQGNLFTKALGANSAMTFSNERNGKTITVVVTSSGAYTITWPAAVKWVGGTEPTMTSGNGKIDIFAFFNDGVATYGSVLQDFS